jgi:hypothetical protein
MDTNKNREGTRLRQAFLRRPWFPNYGGQDGAAGSEWTRMNSGERTQRKLAAGAGSGEAYK